MFYSPEGRPISATKFIELLFGSIPELFRNEDELRKIWIRPDTRRKLLESLEEKGFSSESLEDLKKIIGADKCDIYDVLSYVAYAVPTKTREERVNSSRNVIFANFDANQREFIDFVLKKYLEVGVDVDLHTKTLQTSNVYKPLDKITNSDEVVEMLTGTKFEYMLQIN